MAILIDDMPKEERHSVETESVSQRGMGKFGSRPDANGA